jgi:hypothetical protein
VVNLDLERDAGQVTYADLRQAVAGDRCPRCDAGTFGAHRGIEVGQVFYLGTKYSDAMKAHFLGADGQERPIEMGCYGIGITRTVAAAIEQHHDDAGIVWPAPLAPFGAHVIPVNVGDATLRETAERIAAELEAAGIDTVKTRVIALVLSAFFVGLGGGFYAIYFRYIDPDAVFSISYSVEMVFIAVVGGIATTGGPIVGAIFLVTLSEIFRDHFKSGHLIFYGLFMMLIIRYMPEGIWGRFQRLVSRGGGR